MSNHLLNQVLTIGIDRKSKEAIEKDGYILYYRFGTIPVSGLRRDQEKVREKLETYPPAFTSRESQLGTNSSTENHTEGPTPNVEECISSEEVEQRLWRERGRGAPCPPFYRKSYPHTPQT